MTPPQSVLVSVLRRSDGLFACRIRRAVAFHPPLPDAEEARRDLTALDPYQESVEPLEEARQPWKSVLDSWKELGRVRTFDGNALSHLLNVLVHTLPDESGDDPPPLTFEPEPAAWKPTAANPRAYRGTKDRPLKTKKSRTLDLRPHLSSPRDVNALLLKLAPFRQEAERLLNESGLAFGEIPALLDDRGRVRDVYLDWFHQAGHQSLLPLPPLFRRGFLFGQRGAPWKRVLRVLDLYRTLDLEHRPALRRCVSRLLAHPLTARALDWAELIAEQYPERQIAFATLLVETDVCALARPAGIERLLARASELAPGAVYRHRIHVLLSSLRKGSDPAYFLTGMELMYGSRDNIQFDADDPSGPAPLETLRSLARHTSEPHLGYCLWEACGKLEDFSRVLEDLPWRDLPPIPAKLLLYLLTGVVYEKDRGAECRSNKWRALRQRTPELLDLFREIPERYREKADRHLSRIVWYWSSPEELYGALGDYVSLLRRLCRPPFEEHGFEERILAVLTNLEFSDWEKIRDGPDDLFRAFEKAGRRANDATLIANGLRVLALEESGWVTSALLSDPALVLSAAEKLGSIRRPLRYRALNQWRAHPLLHDRLWDLPTEKLVSLILKHLPEEISSSIPRKLKDHLAGKVLLTPKQVERSRRLVFDALSTVRWRLLGHVCLDQVARRLQPRSRAAKVVHAIRFYGQIDDNRPALRKFLQAHFKGDQDYLRRHPRNQEWLRKQRRLNVDAWLGGLEKSATLQDGSGLRISIEQDPLEALRMGTYVGSCTGLGGSFSDSAAAVVLDLNKHVVYARNEKGAVVGRQLVAVTEQEQLAVYEVYPQSVSSELKRVFRDFDLDLAARLGLELYKPSDDINDKRELGNVELLLSKYWWDDSAWDLQVEKQPG